MDALAHLPLAVVIVAAAADGSRSCSTATATYVSFEPPLVVTPLSAGSRTGALARESGEFSISVLGADQAELAVRAAAGATDKFAERGIAVLEPPAGCTAPAVAGGVAAFWCDVDSTHQAGGHVLFVGRVREARFDAGEPLLRFDRRYRTLGETLEVAAEAAYPL